MPHYVGGKHPEQRHRTTAVLALHQSGAAPPRRRRHAPVMAASSRGRTARRRWRSMMPARRSLALLAARAPR
jgi:hypothetical protein